MVGHDQIQITVAIEVAYADVVRQMPCREWRTSWMEISPAVAKENTD